MNNILNILSNDIRRLTSSVVSIIVIIGLCILPCLYAWFNIFSNWDPYTPEATGRIQVAVANEDEGSDIMGLNINVGEKITEGLKANDAIGWTFVSSKKKALEGLYAGDYYAAVVIPEDFSRDVLSFTSGELNHPELDYYENEKKNAIAPKITNKAQSALKEEVDEAFIDTIGRYVSEAKAVADASGLDPEDVFSDLRDRTSLLGQRMDDLVAFVTAARGLSDAADELLKASGDLTDSTKETLSVGKDVLKDEESLLPDEEKNAKDVSKSVRTVAATIAGNLSSLDSALSAADDGMDAFNQFVNEELDDQKALVHDMSSAASDAADKLSKLGLSGLAARFNKLADQLNGIYNQLSNLQEATDATWADMQNAIKKLLADISSAANTANSISEDAGSDLDNQISNAIADTRQAINDLQKTLDESYSNLGTLNSALSKTEKALKALDGGLDISISSLIEIKSGFGALSELFDSMADSDELKNLNYLLSDGTELIAEKLASPLGMETETIYPIRNFGSMMVSFYTILSLWVGALFSVVLISTKIRRKDTRIPENELTLSERFFGRYRLFLLIGLAQALIVSLGDLLYVGIQCIHPVLFVIAACVIGMIFMMINYALVFVLGKIGMAISVIIVVLQVAGSGGTFPVEVLPGIFRALYPVMPFHYALDAMRECVAGMYGHVYLISLGVLLLMGAVAAAFGLLLARPGEKLTNLIDRSLEENDLIEG